MAVVHLDITSWRGVSIGAVHWYAKVIWYDKDNKRNSIELERSLSDDEVKQINNENKSNGYFTRTIRPGSTTHGFNTEKDAIDFGIKYFKKQNFKGVLYLGCPAICSAFKPIIYYTKKSSKKTIEKMNSLVEKMNKIGGYEGNEVEAEKIDEEWYKLYTKINKSL